MRIGKEPSRIANFDPGSESGVITSRFRGKCSAQRSIRKPKSAVGGFTLAEVLVASTISGFIAIVAVGALKAVADSAHAVNRAGETTAEVRFAARMLARDLANLYRDANPQNMKLIGASQGAGASGPAFLTFYTVGRSKARADQPEGDVYEVEYVLGTGQEEKDSVEAQPHTADAQAQGAVLLRRLWPNPDDERSPGGILTPIARNIGLFQILFFDGEQWVDEWPEEMRSLPELLEITLATLPQGRREPVVESFIVSFPRLAKGTPGSSGETETQPGEPEQPQQAAPPAGEQSGSAPGGSTNQGGSRNSSGRQSTGRRR
jgi:type II secretory pathway component PulJ